MFKQHYQEFKYEVFSDRVQPHFKKEIAKTSHRSGGRADSPLGCPADVT